MTGNRSVSRVGRLVSMTHSQHIEVTVSSHFVHLHVLLVQGQLQVRVVGRWSELIARQHEEDQSGDLHQELQRHRGQEVGTLLKSGCSIKRHEHNVCRHEHNACCCCLTS